MLGIELGTRIVVKTRHAFDGSLKVKINDADAVELLASSVAERLWVDQSTTTPVIVFPENEASAS